MEVVLLGALRVEKEGFMGWGPVAPAWVRIYIGTGGGGKGEGAEDEKVRRVEALAVDWACPWLTDRFRVRVRSNSAAGLKVDFLLRRGLFLYNPLNNRLIPI